MTTLIAVYNSEGCVGRCDARCYEAKNAQCHCICGGRNHSAGKQRAIENTHEDVGLTPDDLERFAKHRTFKCEEIVAVNRVAQPKAKAARVAAYMRLNQDDLFV